MHLIDVLEEHAEETAFLWMLRQRALRSWNYTPKDLARLDQRLLAHLDGLLIGAEAAAEILDPYLDGGEEGEAFAAAYTAVASDVPVKIKRVFEAFEKAEGETLDGIRHALRHTSWPDVELRMSRYLEADRPELIAAAIDVLSFRGSPNAFLVMHLFPERPAIVRTAALTAIERAVDANYMPRVEAILDEVEVLVQQAAPDNIDSTGHETAVSGTESEDKSIAPYRPAIEGPAAIQRAAMRAGFVLKSEKVPPLCRRIIQRRGANADEAFHLLGLAGEKGDQALLFEAVRDPKLQPYAILALGDHGYADAITPLLDMAQSGLIKDLRGVGYVVSRITGVDIARDDLESWADVEASRRGDGPTFDELDAEFTGVVDDPYEGLTPPDLEKLSPWFAANKSLFAENIRLLQGMPMGSRIVHRVRPLGRVSSTSGIRVSVIEAHAQGVARFPWPDRR